MQPELAAPFPLSLQAVSEHLKVLERSGLIVRGLTDPPPPRSVR
jgi:predicted transcriptional regulator